MPHTIQRALHTPPYENPLQEILFDPHFIEVETEAKQGMSKQGFWNLEVRLQSPHFISIYRGYQKISWELAVEIQIKDNHGLD